MCSPHYPVAAGAWTIVSAGNLILMKFVFSRIRPGTPLLPPALAPTGPASNIAAGGLPLAVAFPGDGQLNSICQPAPPSAFALPPLIIRVPVRRPSRFRKNLIRLWNRSRASFNQLRTLRARTHNAARFIVDAADGKSKAIIKTRQMPPPPAGLPYAVR